LIFSPSPSIDLSLFSILYVNTANNSRPGRDRQELEREIESEKERDRVRERDTERERDQTEREITEEGENWRTHDPDEPIDGGPSLGLTIFDTTHEFDMNKTRKYKIWVLGSWVRVNSIMA
jgi:hypothetical protein